MNTNCPSCGAPLRYEEDGSLPSECPYCHNSLPVEQRAVRLEAMQPLVEEAELPPEPVVSASSDAATTLTPDQQSKLLKILLWVIILLVVVPTCVGIAAGLIATIVGIVASLAPLLTFLK
jgi:hypothetical protein